jgi:hypothetical protein
MAARYSPFARLLLGALVALATIGLSAQEPSVPLLSGPVLPLYRALRGVGLDPQHVFKIREADIDREDVHISLTDGTIAFTVAVDGRVTGAYFEGDGEVLVRPPDRMERASLGRFTGAGVLEEKFASAYLRFNDDTAAQLQPYLRPAEDPAAFAAANEDRARTLATMDAMRLCISFTSSPPTTVAGQPSPLPDRMLHLRVSGERYGVFDVYFDTRSPEQIVVGKASNQQDQLFYDLWMSFPMQSLRKAPLSDSRFDGPSGPAWTRDVLTVSKYTIDSKLDPPRELSADATLDVRVKQGGSRIVLFELSRYLQLKQLEWDGKPLEYIQNAAVEGSEMARHGNDIVAVVFPEPLQAGEHFILRFNYAGAVLSDAGGGLIYVGARGNWYPNRGIAMSDYDLTFRFPLPWSLVATGNRVSLTRQGDEFVGHWVSEKSIPIAGFNLGVYVRSSAKAADVNVDVYAARKSGMSSITAANITPELRYPPVPGTSGQVPATPPIVGGAAQTLADRAATTLMALSQMLGPYPFSTLSLAENPSTDSQGWPGLVFLSSFAYLTPEQLQELKLPPGDEVIYSELMMPHELAHQWYGDNVSWASYHEQWLLEALANYSSFLLLERARPADAQLTLQTYRDFLAEKNKRGTPNEEAGPVTLGTRLSSSYFPDGYGIITYGRGTWLIHMLRCMLRDASRTQANPAGDDTAFFGLLRSLVDRYQGKQITNSDFQQAVEDILPRSLWFENRKSLDWFFDGWVNGTAFPKFEVAEVKIGRNAKGYTASGVVRQKSSPPDLVTSVPVYGLSGEQKVYLGRIFAEGEETRFSLPVPPDVKRLVADPYQSVLTAP